MLHPPSLDDRKLSRRLTLPLPLPLTSCNDAAASPTHATSTSERCESDQPPEGFTATLTLINNPDVKVDSFVLSPPSPSDGHTLPSPSSLEEEDRIRSDVVRALEWSAGASGGSSETCPMPREPDQFDVVCLAFGADASMELDDNNIDDGGDSCISQLHRLNGLLRESDSSVSSVNSRASTHPGVSRCPLVASVMSGRKGGVFVSRRNEDSGECSAAAGSVVGAILSGSRDSLTSFQLVHAGRHLALRGSQFEIKHMKDGKIAEVAPVLSMESTPSPAAAAATTGAGAMGDNQSWPRPRCNGGSVSAAEWCQQVVASSTYFEKLAMQSALGVGVLKRARTDDPYRDAGTGSDSLFGGFTSAPVGVMPCLPAQSCFDVQEVELDGSLRLSKEAPLAELREGDLCDFRAVGTLASLQAEQDAYTWLHVSRMSAAMHRMGDDREQQCGGPTHSTVVQGCLVGSTRARFPGGLEGEGCQEVVRSASVPGGDCPTVGSVSDVQLVSVDNTMVTCSSRSGLAGVYVCGSVRGYEQ